MKNIDRKIGLIGVGNMGTAILEGLFSKNLAKPDQVWIYDKMTEKADSFSEKWQTHRASSNGDILKEADIVILAIKPQDLEAMGAELKENFPDNKILLSILAGTPVDKIRKILGTKPAIVRAMPNLGAKVGASITVLSGSDEKSLAIAECVFSGCGTTLVLQEKYFDLGTAVSGSGPAYFFLMMELLAEMGIKHGLPVKVAEQLAVQTALAAGRLAQEASVGPAELRKMVTSKGGTTAAALDVLEAKNFRESFHEALQAALDRGRELSQ